jgi:AICAR transformylase/IMP cyclohydrolase PurH
MLWRTVLYSALLLLLLLLAHKQGGIATAVQHHGKEMSYNNYLDADAAYSCCCDFKVNTATTKCCFSSAV